MARSCANLGVMYRTRGELDRAVELFEKSLAIESALGLRKGIANTYGELGNVYLTRGELDCAMESWKLTVGQFETLDSPHVVTLRSWIAELDCQETDSILFRT